MLSSIQLIQLSACFVGGQKTNMHFATDDDRDFKIRYGKGLLRLHKVKITSGDVTTRVAVRLSRRSLIFIFWLICKGCS